MTPDERDELQRDLEAAGCPSLASAVGEFLGGAYLAELRRLLSREVWVVQLHDWETGGCLRAAFSQHDHASDWMNRCMKNHGVVFTQHTIDAEVPDADG